MSNNKGFSIVELLIGGVVAGVITAAGVALVNSQIADANKMALENDAAAARGILEMIAHGGGCTLSTQGVRIEAPTPPLQPDWRTDPTTQVNLRLAGGLGVSSMEFGSWQLLNQTIPLSSCTDATNPSVVCNPLALPQVASFQGTFNLDLQVRGAVLVPRRQTLVAPITLYATNQAGVLVVTGCTPPPGSGGGGGGPNFSMQELCEKIGPGRPVGGNPTLPVWTATGTCDVRRMMCLAMNADWNMGQGECASAAPGGSRLTFQNNVLSLSPLCGAGTFIQGATLHPRWSWACGLPRSAANPIPPSCGGTGCIRRLTAIDTRAPCTATDMVPEINVLEAGGPRLTNACGEIEVQGRQLCDAQCNP